MPELNPSSKQEAIVSVTFSLVQNADGVRYWEPMSGLDESKLTVEDVAKFQYHLLHWHAAMQETLVRVLMKHRDEQGREAERITAELGQLCERIKAWLALIESQNAKALNSPGPDDINTPPVRPNPPRRVCLARTEGWKANGNQPRGAAGQSLRLAAALNQPLKQA